MEARGVRLGLLLLTVAGGVACAGRVELAAWPPHQIGPVDSDVSGMRLALIGGENAALTGFDFSILETTAQGPVNGVQLALLDHNTVRTDAAGLQIAAAGNEVEGAFSGLQLAVGNQAREVRGLQLGIANLTEDSHVGLQIGAGNASGRATGAQLAALVNLIEGGAGPDGPARLTGLQVAALNEGGLRGLQIGVLNRSEDAIGLQIGLMNSAGKLSGLQLGLLNYPGDTRWPWPLIGFDFDRGDRNQAEAEPGERATDEVVESPSLQSGESSKPVAEPFSR